MQCRYCEQNSATRGRRRVEVSVQCISSSSASGAKALFEPGKIE